MRYYKLLPLLFILFSSLSFSIHAAEEEGFPGRAKYPSVPYITLQDLYQKRNTVVIVDTRSKYEHSTLHIKNSINIPISSLDFSSQIRKLYKQKKKTIVFYCNGHECTKSYDAVIKSKRFAKVDDTLAFDAGIFDWARKHPRESVLLGKSPVESTDLIAVQDFEKHLLKPKAFLERSNDKCIILDVRDSAQRTDRIFAGYEQSVDLDDTIGMDKHINEAIAKKQPLCIYDAVGEQVRWLQYYLKQKKLKNYYFLDGGAKAFFETPYKELYGS